MLLADFGLAKVKTETKSIATKTGRGVTSGSVRWMAPEILNFGKYTAACDVFSFGIFLWELFTREVTLYVKRVCCLLSWLFHCAHCLSFILRRLHTRRPPMMLLSAVCWLVGACPSQRPCPPKSRR